MNKSSRFTGLVLALLGLTVLLNNLGKPRIEALHGSDVMGLSLPAFASEWPLGLIGRLKIRNE